jgi:hypothetical protein
MISAGSSLPALALARTCTPTAAPLSPTAVGTVTLTTTSAVDASPGAPVPATMCATPGTSFTAFPLPRVPLRSPTSSATGFETSVLRTGS